MGWVGMCAMTDDAKSYLQQWTAPPTILATLGMLVTLYASHVIQQERVAALKVQVDAIARDYQRQDVLREQLRTIDMRLSGIEVKLDQRSSTNGAARR